MGKSKKKKKKKSREEEGLLEGIDKNLISQYYDVREDIENFQYQLYKADKKTRKAWEKAIKSGKPFVAVQSPSVKKRKEIMEQLGRKDGHGEDFLDKIIRLCRDMLPIMKILGRLVAALILAIFSIEDVKKCATPATLEKADKIFSIGLAV